MDDGRENRAGGESTDERLDRLEGHVGELRAELNQALRELEGTTRGASGEKAGALDGWPASGGVAGATGRASFDTARRVAEQGTASAPAASETDSRRGSRAPLDLGNLGDLRSGEWWLGRIGIGLLLFGVVFLFTYSVQRGWLTPQVQVGIGLAVGAALLGMGLRAYEDRRVFSRVLLGGGVGAFYITGFAAYQVHAFAPYPLVFGFMVAVTLLACVLSLRQDDASLSVIGASGGLGTPFVLYSGAGSLGGLVLYACLILSGTTAVYLYKGWISLLIVSSAVAGPRGGVRSRLQALRRR